MPLSLIGCLLIRLFVVKMRLPTLISGLCFIEISDEDNVSNPRLGSFLPFSLHQLNGVHSFAEMA